MKKAICLIISVLIPLASAPSLNASVKIDWTKGIIRANGLSSIAIRNGKPIDPVSGSRTSLTMARNKAYRKAVEKAKQEIIMTVLSIKADSQYTFRDILRIYDISRTRLAEIIENKLIRKEYPAGHFTSGCAATLKMGDLIEIAPFSFPGDPFPTRMDTPVPTEYSSLIVDTRGLNINPMIFPSVYDEKGLEIYGRNFINVEQAAQYGMVTYAHNEHEAINLKRAGSHPYITAAVSSLKECPVISDNAVRKILSSPASIERLRRCHVIFIIDRKGKP